MFLPHANDIHRCTTSVLKRCQAGGRCIVWSYRWPESLQLGCIAHPRWCSLILRFHCILDGFTADPTQTLACVLEAFFGRQRHVGDRTRCVFAPLGRDLYLNCTGTFVAGLWESCILPLHRWSYTDILFAYFALFFKWTLAASVKLLILKGSQTDQWGFCLGHSGLPVCTRV